MLGFRGASRYISGDFSDAFAMECEALKRVRKDMGLPNIEIMVPFVRTVRQAEGAGPCSPSGAQARAALGGTDGLRVIMMCEVPSNAILAEAFLEHFDGMSIGSNDLTQLTLGLDRDSGLEQLAGDFDERDPAVKAMISRAIRACRAVGGYIGICGQGPSDHPDFCRLAGPGGHRVHLAQPGHGDRHLAATLGAGPLKAKFVRRRAPVVARPAQGDPGRCRRAARLTATTRSSRSASSPWCWCWAWRSKRATAGQALDRLHLPRHHGAGLRRHRPDVPNDGPGRILRGRAASAGGVQRHGGRRRLDERGLFHRPGRHALCVRL